MNTAQQFKKEFHEGETVSVQEMMDRLAISRPTALALVRQFKLKPILSERRAKIYQIPRI